MSSSLLKIDWATHEAAKYACESWHYSKRVPVNKLLKLGVWEKQKFIGVVLFGVGTSAQLHKPFGIERSEVCELARVALTKHVTPVTRIISISLRFLKKSNPKLKICVSFADSTQGHHGGIYQGGNWIYTGRSSTTTEYYIKNRWVQTTSNNYPLIKKFRGSCKERRVPGKHRYLMPLNEEMKNKIMNLSKPYPKRASSKDNVVTTDQVVEGGVIPTDALHFSEEKYG